MHVPLMLVLNEGVAPGLSRPLTVNHVYLWGRGAKVSSTPGSHLMPCQPAARGSSNSPTISPLKARAGTQWEAEATTLRLKPNKWPERVRDQAVMETAANPGPMGWAGRQGAKAAGRGRCGSGHLDHGWMRGPSDKATQVGTPRSRRVWAGHTARGRSWVSQPGAGGGSRGKRRVCADTKPAVLSHGADVSRSLQHREEQCWPSPARGQSRAGGPLCTRPGWEVMGSHGTEERCQVSPGRQEDSSRVQCIRV